MAVDTNVLAYAEGTNGGANQRAALNLLQTLPPEYTLVPAQALGELFNVLVKKARWSRADARRGRAHLGRCVPAHRHVARGHALGNRPCQHTSTGNLGCDCAVRGLGCRLLLSEDLQDGFAWSGVTVVNPFAKSLHPLLAAQLSHSS